MAMGNGGHIRHPPPPMGHPMHFGRGLPPNLPPPREAFYNAPPHHYLPPKPPGNPGWIPPRPPFRQPPQPRPDRWQPSRPGGLAQKPMGGVDGPKVVGELNYG
jgi:hypothetical protein